MTNQFVIYVYMCVYISMANQFVESPTTLSSCITKHMILAAQIFYGIPGHVGVVQI